MSSQKEREEAFQKLIALREEFRKQRPDLKLPPAGVAPSRRTTSRVPDEDELYRAEIRARRDSLSELANNDPNHLLNLIKQMNAAKNKR